MSFELPIEVISPNVTFIQDVHASVALPINDIAVTIHNGIYVIDWVAQHPEKEDLERFFSQLYDAYQRNNHIYPVSVTGLKDVDAGVGSHRFCIWNSRLAHQLSILINRLAILQQSSPAVTDTFLGVSRYFRCMQYQKGGEHFPHYDSDFRTPEQITKYSLVMYFSSSDSGELAFVDDNTHHAIDHSDWEQQAKDVEIYLKIKPRVGRIVIFPHDKCHTVLPHTGKNPRRVMRGDLIYTAPRQDYGYPTKNFDV